MRGRIVQRRMTEAKALADRLALVVLVLGLCFCALPVASADPEGLPEDVAGMIDARYRTIELSDGFLYEPLPDYSDLPIVEISSGELWVNGAPATADALASLGEFEDVFRTVAEREGVDLERLGAEVGSGAEAVEETTLPESPEAPEAPEAPRRVHKDDQVVVGGNLVVEENVVARDVVVFGGQLEVRGEVNGDAAVIGGSAEIDGRVSGDVAIVGGSAEIGPNARILGDVETVGGSVDVHEDAVIEGEINEVSFGAGIQIGRWVEDYAKGATGGDGVRADGDVEIDFKPEKRRSGFMYGLSRIVRSIFLFLFLCLVSGLVLLFLRNPIDRIGEQARLEPAKSGLVGLVTWILLAPLLFITVLILVISVIGIPLLVLLPFVLVGFALLVFVGFVAVALEIGRFLQSRFDLNIASPFALLVLGLFVIELWGLIAGLFGVFGRYMGFITAMFTVFGILVSFLAVTIGLGAALLTRAGTRSAETGLSWGREPSTGDDLRYREPDLPPPPVWDDPVDDDYAPEVRDEDPPPRSDSDE